MDLSSPSYFFTRYDAFIHVVLFNHNVNVRLEQMKKNNRCKVTMTP